LTFGSGMRTLYVPLPAIFALRYAWIHIGSSDNDNETSYVKALVDDFFGG